MKKVRTWLDADRAVKEFGLLEIKRKAIEGEANARITKIKTRAAKRIETLDRKRKALATMLEVFSRHNRHEMDFVKKGGGKTRNGVFGKLAFQKNPSKIELVKTLKTVLAALKKHKLTDCIRTVEGIDKDAMKKLDAEKLKTVGAKLIAGETFIIKPDYTAIQNTK